MLIMNQSKDTIYNMDKIISIECTENGVVMQGDKAESSITLGTYESEARAKEVLIEILDAYTSYFRGENKNGDVNFAVAIPVAYIMPDK